MNYTDVYLIMESTSHSGVNYGAQVGINYGTFTADFHLPPERPETPPSPLSTVPFTRDPDFVRRDKLLDQIYDKSSVAGSRLALIGLGGVGKSQLAIEYSYQVRSKSPATWVFWVHASNEARFEQSFRDIADQAKILGRQDPKVNIFKLVENWLRDEKIGNWVCILDNVDDDQLLRSVPVAGKGDPTRGPTNTSTKPLLEYVPRCRNGSIIITSRSRDAALKMVDHKGLLEVKSMERFEALELLQRKLENSEERQASQTLVNALEFMPLAIVQAASYVRSRAPRYSVSQYLKDFQRSDREATKLLKKKRPSAAELLSLMSFFDRQGIHENLLRHQANYTKGSELLSDSSDGKTSECDNGADFEDDIMTLRNYSFISVIENNTLFTMHRLVQLTTRAWLKSHGQIDQWKDRFISTLCDEFPTGEYENWERCRPLFAHVKCAISQRPVSPECLQQWATLLYRGAWYAWQSGNTAEMREMASKSRDQRAILLGKDHAEVLRSTGMLATAYWLEGQWEKAEQLQVQVMESCRRKLGEDHPDTLDSMTNLASTYRDQGRWGEAEQLEMQVMVMSKTKLGVDHPDTLTSMSNLAWTFWNQGRWQEAEQIEIQVIGSRKTKLGDNHPDTLNSVANLASTYREQGRWEEAEQLQVQNQGRWEEAEQLEVQVIKGRKMKLGVDHPDTLDSIANLVSTYGSQDRWEEAKHLEMQVIVTSKTKLGVDHPSTLTSMNNLASMYCDQGQWKEAEQLQIQVMQTRKMKLSEDHPDTLRSIANLVSTYCDQGRWEEAEQLQVQVMVTSKTKLGVDHPDTLASMTNLAATFWKQGRWEEAEQLQVQVMESCRRKLGEDHPDTLDSMTNLVSTYRDQGRWEEAEQLRVKVMVTSKTKLGVDHPSTLVCMNNLAVTYCDQGRCKEAEQLQAQVMVTSKTKLGVDHPSTLTSMNNLALTYRDQGRCKEAEQLQVQVMETRKTKLGEDHPDTLTSMANLAYTWKSSGHNVEAINLLRDCFTRQKQILGLNHPNTLSVSEKLLEWETEALNMNA
ncbi:hypothetical protein N7541_001113 [Penicillium brevicompactum]|uniref:DUF7779 domain-containing protein n=1 Tax=Penicillium brevicompactum TaxID=5074 RepID=A0A9W9RVN9_PENBR|nr:hypothetical protein N7541_001113 [Penicillium brevicompactum]